LIVDAGAPLYPDDVRARIAASSGPRILVTAPVHIRVLVNEPGGMPRADLILSATAPLPAALAAQAEACFGGRLVEIYGCTEAGQVATRRTAQEAHWRCLDDISLFHDEAGTWASGAAVEGRALLHDGIDVIGPGTFLLGGRSADLVDVAGKRASLAHLNYQLTSIEGVKDGVFLPREAAGERVARLMALAVAPGLHAETILRALRERIDVAFLPRPLVLVDALPRNALGKLPREALLELIGRGRGS
jgi:acyl-coenzyme A synthetase/AMP-(fatty) acid ligase